MEKLIKKLVLITIGVVVGRVVKKEQVRFYSSVNPNFFISLVTGEKTATILIQKAGAIKFYKANRN